MSHMVETLAYAGETPWHGLGLRLDGRTTATDLLDRAGLNWTVEGRPVHAFNTRNGLTNLASGYQAITRVEDGSVLSIQSDAYGIVQNQALAELAEAMAGEGAAWEVGASLDGGRKVFLCGVVDEQEIAGDQVKGYLTLASSHDGSLSVTAAKTPVRVVCANTLATFLSTAAGRPRISVPHRKNAAANVKLATELVKDARAYFGAFREQALTLVGATMHVVQAEQVAADLFPAYKSEDTGQVVTPEMREIVLRLFQGMGYSSADSRFAGTAWGFYMALTAALDHNRRGSDTSRLKRFLAGSDDTLRSRAWRMLTGGRA